MIDLNNCEMDIQLFQTQEKLKTDQMTNIGNPPPPSRPAPQPPTQPQRMVNIDEIDITLHSNKFDLYDTKNILDQ